MAGALNAPLQQVGGKAASLARLVAGGIPVPEFFVVLSQALRAHLSLNATGLAPEPADRPDPESLALLRRRIAESPLPERVAHAVLNSYSELARAAGQDVVAVRSSGADEDSAGASFAGQFSSILGTSGHQAVVEAVKRVWSSCLSEDAVAYRRARGIELDAGISFAVIVQAQVFAEKAGVLFTRHPLEPDGDLAYLEANFGTGESVVGGMITPDSVSVSRTTLEVVESTTGSKRRMTVVSKEHGSRTLETDPARRRISVLSESEAKRIVTLGLEIEELMGRPQDIEWALDAAGLWVLQARPQTGPA